MVREIRNTNNEITPILPESRLVSGYAIVFNSDSNDLGGFTERINPDALNGVVEKSDVLCLLNHNEDRGVLARSNKGEGSLTLEIDEIGLKYSFEAPNTALGDELLEGLRRGDISTSSFAFTVEKDSWSKNEDGSYLRTINSISELFDVSPVYRAAYDATSVKVDSRGLEAFKQQEAEEVEKAKLEELAKRCKELEKEFEQIEEPVEPSTDENIDNTNESTTEDNLQIDNNLTNKRTMEKFSLLKAIKAVTEKQPLDERSAAIVNEGIAEMRKTGLSFNGQIQLPVEERADVQATVATAGMEAVATDKLNILEPLRANLVMAQAGATFMTGLVGNVAIPMYDGSTVGWEGEIDPAKDGAGKFSEIELTPKRLTAFIDVSKQFLLQDSVSAEAMLRNDIVKALSNKLEATILGDEAGSNKVPAGIFNGAGAATATYAGTVDMEEMLEEANVGGEYTYIVSPKAKAALRTAKKGENGFVMEDGEVNGIKVLCTSAAKGMVLGNFSEYVIAQWELLTLLLTLIHKL